MDNIEKDIDQTVDTGLEDIFKSFMKSPSIDRVMEGKRRAVIRKILLGDDRINLPKEIKYQLGGCILINKKNFIYVEKAWY